MIIISLIFFRKHQLDTVPAIENENENTPEIRNYVRISVKRIRWIIKLDNKNMMNVQDNFNFESCLSQNCVFTNVHCVNELLSRENWNGSQTMAFENQYRARMRTWHRHRL